MTQPAAKKPIWYAPDDPTPREQCPCCDYISLAERGGYLIYLRMDFVCKCYMTLRQQEFIMWNAKRNGVELPEKY